MSAFTTDPFHTSNCRCCEAHARTMAERDRLKADLAAARARVAELEADRRNLLDDDLKAAVCVQLQRELNDAKDDRAAARVLLRQARWALAYHQQQTRPIHSTAIVLGDLDAALAREKK